MKRALICGVSGQDGSYLAKLLLDKGYKVYGTSRDAQITPFNNLTTLGIRDHVTTLSMAPNDFRSVITVLSKVEPHELYNLAGQSSVGLSFEQPVEAMESIGASTLNLLEAIRFHDMNVRFYNAGSSECFGDVDNVLATEKSPFRPRSPYAVAKCAAHWQVANYREAYGLFACTGILFNHESCLRPERFATQKIVQAARRVAAGSTEKLVLGNTRVVRDWGWAPEFVDAMWRMLQRDEPDDVVVATGHSASLQTFVQLTFERLGLDWTRHVVVDKSLFRPTDILVSRADPSKAAKVLGWTAKYQLKDVIEHLITGQTSSR